MGLVCLTRNFIHAPLAERERLHLPEKEIVSALQTLRSEVGLGECVLLCTCNRTELYFDGPADRRTGPALAALGRLAGAPEVRPESMPLLQGEEAIRHLFRLAAGLESLVVGENQILGQLKTAYRLACEAQTGGFFVNEWFHRAFRTGKRVRTETALCSGGTSVGTVAVEHAAAACDLSSRRALIVGAGEISELVLRALATRGPRALTLCNRTIGRGPASLLAKRHSARLTPLEELPAELLRHDLVFSATASPDFVLRADAVRAAAAHRRPDDPLRLYDLALPRDIEPEAAAFAGVLLVVLDDLAPFVRETLDSRTREIPRAEAIVEAAVGDYAAWRHELAAVPSIRRLLNIAEAARREEASRLAGHLPPAALAESERSQRRLVQNLMRNIIEELKRTARESAHATRSGQFRPPSPGDRS